MDPSAPAAHAQSDKNGTSKHQPSHPVAPSATGNHAAPASDLMNSLPQADLPPLPPLQNLPADMDLLSMMVQGGTLLPDNELMPMMPTMPMVIDGSSVFNIPRDSNSTPNVPQDSITNDEIAQYDRQIRLWGIEAQQRIRNANVLLITMKGLGNEIAKNLVLAGIKSLTAMDHENVTMADLGAQFLTSEDSVGMNRAQAVQSQIQKLNPRVNVIVDTDSVRIKTASYFARFDMVIATDLDPDALNIINTATRVNKRLFYAAGTHGLYGFIFADLIEHTFMIERDQPNVATQPKAETRTRRIAKVQTKVQNDRRIEIVTKEELYSTWLLASDGAFLPEEYTKSKRRLRAVSPVLSCLRALWEFQAGHGGRNPADKNDLVAFTRIATQKHKDLSLPAETLTAEFLRNFLQNIGCEIAPVTAILGGQLAQDVLNVFGKSQQPIQNMVIFDGNNMEASLYPLHPQCFLGEAQLSSGMPGIPDMGNVDMNGFGVPDPLMAVEMEMPPVDMNMNLGNLGGMSSTGNAGPVGSASEANTASS